MMNFNVLIIYFNVFQWFESIWVYLNVFIVYINVFECIDNIFMVYFDVSIMYFNAFESIWMHLNVFRVYLNVFECIHSVFEYISVYLQCIYGVFECMYNVFECIWMYLWYICGVFQSFYNWISPWSYLHCNIFATHTHLHICFSFYTMTPFPTCYAITFLYFHAHWSIPIFIQSILTFHIYTSPYIPHSTFHVVTSCVQSIVEPKLNYKCSTYFKLRSI
jgi:hypothetical protein